jgi:hypothetical protein
MLQNLPNSNPNLILKPTKNKKYSNVSNKKKLKAS